MSIETDFRAMLAAASGVTALVGQRIALNQVEQGAALPLVVFACRREPEYALDNTLLSTLCTFDVQCWGFTGASASAVADAVAAAALAAGYRVNGRNTVADDETGADGVVLTCDTYL